MSLEWDACIPDTTQYFSVVMFIVLYAVALTTEPLDEICDVTSQISTLFLTR